MKQKSVGLTLRAAILALALILVAGSPALPPFDGVAYAQSSTSTLSHSLVPVVNDVQLDWTEVVGADSYRLWKGEGSGQSVSWGDSAHMTFDAPTVTYVDNAVTAGMTYSYVVEVYDGDTRLGWSNVENVTIPGGTQKPTEKPDVTLAADGLTAITVTWSEVSDADHYRVRYWTSGLSGWMDIATQATRRMINHTGLSPGTQYYYIVRGENAAGNGPYSGEPGNYASLTLGDVDPVPTLTGTHVSRQVVQLSWTATSATAYNLDRGKSTADSPESTDITWSAVTLTASDIASRTYTDNNAAYETGTTMYYYRVQAVKDGTPGQWSDTYTVTIPDTGIRPVAPTGLMAEAGSNAVSVIRLAWTPTPGTTSEIRWKSGSRDWSNAMAASSPYNHTGLSASTEYTYQVLARNVNGPSLWSAEVSHETAAAPATGGQMPQVTGLTVTDESTEPEGVFTPKIKLMWDSVASATHYDIRRFNPGATSPAWGDPTDPDLTDGRIAVDALESISSPSWEDNDSSITAATTYYYVVSAVNENASGAADDEMGEWSDYDHITTIAASVGDTAPADLEVTVTGPTALWLSWTAVGNATSYTIKWRADNGSERTMTATGTTYYHSRLNPNTEYLYRVRAENSSSMTPYSDPEKTATTWRSGLQPPTNVSAEDATTRDEDGSNEDPMVKVSWTEATGATGYHLQKWDSSANPPAWADVGSLTDRATTTDTSQNDEGVVAAMMYYYRVRTVSATDMSGWSSVVSATTDPARPTTAPVLVATSTGMSMIRLSWGAVANAMDYKLEVMEGRADADADFDPDELAHSETLSGNVRHYVHSGLKAGTRYSYRLKAVLSTDVETLWSNKASSYTKPGKPELMVGSADHERLTLRWDPVPFVTDADPTADGHLTAVTEYRVERRMAGTSDWSEVNISAGIGDCTDDAEMKCMFTDADLTAETRYFYRIRATATRGDASFTSYWDYANQYTTADPAN